MYLLLAAVFAAVMLGLLWSDYGPRQRAMLTGLAISVTTLYYVFASRLM